MPLRRFARRSGTGSSVALTQEAVASDAIERVENPSIPISASETISAASDSIMSLARTRDYFELVKFSHTLFALPFAILGAVLAAYAPDGRPAALQDWAGILLCMATARSAAMAFNRLADRHYDALNPRTASRHLPSGRLSVGAVAIFTLVSAAAFIASTLLFLPNRWPIILSIPVLLWLLGYSYTKRFTSLAHFWLGLSLSLAPIAAWIALRGDLRWPPVLLAMAVLLWVSGFDIIYACQDVEFDRHPACAASRGPFGIRGALRIAAACHALMIVPLVALGLVYPLGTDLFPRSRRRGRTPGLRARPGSPRRPDPREYRLLSGEHCDQPRPAGRCCPGPDPLTRPSVAIEDGFSYLQENRSQEC